MPRRSRGYRSRKSRAGRIFIFILLLSILFVFIDAQVSPSLETAIENQTRLMSTKAINEAVEEQLQKSGLDYDRLVNIQKDEGGTVTSISTNMALVNQLKSSVTLAIQQKLMEEEEKEQYIYLGTVLGGNWLRDRGPKLPFRFTLHGNIKCELENQFESAGINQTRHSVNLVVETHVSCMVPWFKSQEITEKTTFCIAETVIVGEVPKVYAGLGRDTGEVSGRE